LDERYEKTKANNWTMLNNGQPGKVIHSITIFGTTEFFGPNILDNELKGMYDTHSNIHFHKLFEWMLSLFDGKSFFNVCQQGCTTTCCTASKPMGGHQSTIIRQPKGHCCEQCCALFWRGIHQLIGHG
jgi:hypothetical protein